MRLTEHDKRKLAHLKPIVFDEANDIHMWRHFKNGCPLLMHVKNRHNHITFCTHPSKTERFAICNMPCDCPLYGEKGGGGKQEPLCTGCSNSVSLCKCGEEYKPKLKNHWIKRQVIHDIVNGIRMGDILKRAIQKRKLRLTNKERVDMKKWTKGTRLIYKEHDLCTVMRDTFKSGPRKGRTLIKWDDNGEVFAARAFEGVYCPAPRSNQPEEG